MLAGAPPRSQSLASHPQTHSTVQLSAQTQKVNHNPTEFTTKIYPPIHDSGFTTPYLSGIRNGGYGVSANLRSPRPAGACFGRRARTQDSGPALGQETDWSASTGSVHKRHHFEHRHALMRLKFSDVCLMSIIGAVMDCGEGPLPMSFCALTWCQSQDC